MSNLRETVVRLESDLSTIHQQCEDLRRNVARLEPDFTISRKQCDDANNHLFATDAAFTDLTTTFREHRDRNPLQSKIAELEQSIEKVGAEEKKLKV